MRFLSNVSSIITHFQCLTRTVTNDTSTVVVDRKLYSHTCLCLQIRVVPWWLLESYKVVSVFVYR